MDYNGPMLTFMIADGLYAVTIRCVQEILDAKAPTQLPNAPQYLQGMIDLRGSNVPVVDLRTLMGYVSQGDTSATRILVVLIYDGKTEHLIGLRCDKVNEVAMIDLGTFAPFEAGNLLRWTDRAICGIGRRNGNPVSILDLNMLFSAIPDVWQRQDLQFGAA